MKLLKYFLIGLLVCSVTMTSCDGCSDETESPTQPPSSDSSYDPNIFCNENLCATNAELKQQCIDTFNYCMANEIDLNDDECVGMALFICRAN